MQTDVRAKNISAAARFLSAYRFELLLLAVAAALWWPYADGRSTYAYAELVRDLSVTRDLAAGHVVLLGPPSSLGAFRFGPAYYFLLLPFAAIFGFARYSLAAASMLFLLATVALVGVLCRRWFGDRTLSLLAMAMMVLANIDLQLAKYGSNPNFVPFFTALFFLAMERLIDGSRRSRDWAVLGLATGVLVQLHAVPLIVIPLVLAVALGKKWLRFSMRGFGWFASAAAVVLSPPLWYEATHGFSNAAALFGIAHQPFDLPGYSAHFCDYLGFWFSPWISLHGYFNVFNYWGIGLFALAAPLSVALFVAVRRDLRSTRTTQFTTAIRPSVQRALRLWLAVPSAVLLAPVPGLRVLHVYYFFTLLPVAFIVYALLVRRLWLNGRRRVTIVLAFTFLLLQIAQLALYWQVVGAQLIPS